MTAVIIWWTGECDMRVNEPISEEGWICATEIVEMRLMW